MRIKFLSVIVSFLLLSFGTTSCLDSDNTIIEYSSDATIHAFALDPILEVDYKFTIDQIAGKVYNQDSLPVGSDTIIDRAIIKKLTTASNIVTMKNKDNQDSIINISDSIDLSTKKYTEDKPFVFKVWAPDMVTTKEYKLWVNVHRQDPDSMQWVKMPSGLPSNLTAQKAVILKRNNKEIIFVYTANAAHKGEISQSGQVTWTVADRGDLPNIALTSLINFAGTLYATTGNGDVYQSTDGEDWTASSALSGGVDVLLAAFPENSNNLNKEIVGLAGIIDGKFGITDKSATTWKVSENSIPSNFPKYGTISSTVYLSATNIQTGMLMGNNQAANDTASVAWASQDGMSWAELTNTSSDSYCPVLNTPSIIHYNDALYAFGGLFQTFYKSIAGIAWYKADSKFWMPTEFKNRSNYSMVIDESHHIWMMWGNGEVWRGHLNKLGFKRQI